MHGKAAEARGRTATKEQMRMALVTQDAEDDDRFHVQKMIKKIMETTQCSQDIAELALHDAENNMVLAINNLLENPDPGTWSHCNKKKGSKDKGERDEPQKKGGNRPARRGNQRGDFQQKRTENGNEGRENRQPRNNNKEDGETRRKPQDRPRREPKREGKKPNAEHKEEEEEQWKNGPLVFNRRDNIEEKESHVAEPIKPIAQPTAAGPLSFADVVRKSAQKPQPPPVAEPAFNKLQVNDTKQAPQSPHSLGDGLQSDENTGFLIESSKSPRQATHHLDMDGALLREDPAVSFGAQKLQQSLTAQLKNDLGLGDNNAFGTSPPKKYHEPLHQNKASTVKAGIVEFMTSNAPAVSSGDWQFGFEATSVTQSTVADEQQFRREPPSKINEPTRNEIGLVSSNLNESNLSRNNASAVLNQYQQQQSSQPSYSHQPFNRNRNGANLPFSNNNYSDNFNPSDLRPNNYGAPSSPPKTQPVQPLGSQQMQQSQQGHHHHQQMFPPAQLPYPNYPYLNMNMYSPVAGLRDEFTPILPFQNSLYQLNMDALTMMPQLANATSAGPLPNSHQGQHHQNSHPQQSNVQQGMQHNQGSHSQNQRNEHYNENLFKQMNIPPASQQNNGATNHSQQNSNLGNQQRQQLVDSQGSVAPPPGFGNLAASAGPFLSQRNMPPMSFQLPQFSQFPYVLPKSK